MDGHSNRDRVFHSVTAVRGLAALAVCWFHMTVMGLLPYGPLAPTAAIGWLGPHIFFIVSGFVIPWSLWLARYHPGDAPRYLARRIVRLDPPYLASILLILGLDYIAVVSGLHQSPFSLDWGRLVSHIAYLTGIVGEIWYQPVFWTLAIEFQFYLFLSLAFPLVADRRRRIRWGFMLACLLAFAPWCEIPEAAFAPVAEFPSSVWVTGYLPLFMLGFVLFQRHAGLIGEREAWGWAIPLSILVGTYTYVLAPLAFLAFAVMYADRIRGAITGFLGRISYSLYLIHIPVGIPFQSLLGRLATTDAERALVVAASVPFCIFAAWVFYLLVERPSLTLARRIPLRKPQPRPVKTLTTSSPASS